MAVDSIPGELTDETREYLRDLRTELRANTMLTKALAQQVEALSKTVQPISDTYVAAAGFWRTVSWIGDAGVTLGKAAAVLVLLVAASWVWLKDAFKGPQP